MTKTRKPLEYETVNDGRYEEHLKLLSGLDGDTVELESALEQITWQELERFFHSVGEVVTIYHGEQIAGFYWIEERGHTLHLHSLILKPRYRGRGIGREALKKLVNNYRGKMDSVELGLHMTNIEGLAFFLREGFEQIGDYTENGFIILKKNLRE